LLHIVFDNEVYEASGSKKTATEAGTDLVELARAAGIENAQWAESVEVFAQVAERALKGDAVSFIGVKVGTERAPVGPYPIDEVENKYRFIRYVEKSANIAILKTNLPASYD
jgi:thiamine pyrophosphate-dependent acetolactate synthase large subunit-like protein